MAALQVPTARYTLQHSEDPVFIAGGGADVILRRPTGGDVRVGVLGIVHPHVLKNFTLSYPVSLLELSVRPFV